MIHVYTGDGKGKTTAAFGLAVRAVGRKKRVLFAQFLKGGGEESGEILAARRMLPSMELMRFDQIHPCFDPAVNVKALSRTVQQDFSHVQRLILGDCFDLAVLDEINNCISQHLMPVDALLDLMDRKPEPVELVLTGRGADPRVIEKADYVTELRKIKHPSETEGASPREGIEF